MCGIVGYIGKSEAYPILIQGLHRLEYRGYDSAGVALINHSGELKVYKSKGKVSALEHYAEDKDTCGTVGIAGYTFRSDTDTEVIVQLIEYIMEQNACSLYEAVLQATKEIVGAYAIAVIDKDNPDQIIAARRSSPLVIGIGNDFYYLASDATPIVEYTKKVVYLEDGEIAIINRDQPLRIMTEENVESKINICKLKMSISELEKGGYPHFMLKEIFEQPKTLLDCLSGRVSLDGKHVAISGIIDNKERFLRAERVIIVACGTSWHAGLIGKHLIEDFCRIPVVVEYASEFRYSNPVVTDRDILIAISQSGETADTLAALELAKSHGAFVFGICNVIGSSIPRATHSGCYIHVGPEIGVASTKAFTGQVTVLAMIALVVGKLRGTIDEDKYELVAGDLRRVPSLISKVLELDGRIRDLSKIFTYAHNFIYLGRGYNYPTAMEGALKLKEISYIHAEGYPAAEMKHGPIALIDNEMPTVVIATADSIYDKTVSNIQQIKARGGRVMAIVTEGDTVASAIADYVIEIPEITECLSPLLTSVPLQLLAYYIAVNKGRDVDQPRNLAKSVTVE